MHDIVHHNIYLSVSWCCRRERVADRKSGMDVDTLNTLSLISLERLIHWSMITNQPVLQVERRKHVKLDILLPVSEMASKL